METQFEKVLSGLIRSQFADLAGSTAALNLRLPEKLLNDVIAAALASQRANYPWLALVKSVHVKGSLELEVRADV